MSMRNWTTKVESRDDEDEEFAPFAFAFKEKKTEEGSRVQVSVKALGRRKLKDVAVGSFRSMMGAFSMNRPQRKSSSGLSGRVVGTLFGSKRGRVHLAFQKDPISYPALLIEFATPMSDLVKEMSSGLVRIALECDKVKYDIKKSSSGIRLLQEPVFRTHCNGKKCGVATRRECGNKEWRLLKAVEPISMGAGVLPRDDTENDSDEIMYMRGMFERVVGSRDSESFYMMNPDSNCAPELSVYLLRV